VSELQASSTRRVAAIGMLGLLLGIPLILIGFLVDDRQAYYDKARYSVAEGWSGPQHVASPVLIVPRVQGEGWQVEQDEAKAIIAVEVDARVLLKHTMRHRGIFELPVYDSEIAIHGAFDQRLAEDEGELDWSRARLVMYVSNWQGMRDIQMTFAAQPIAMRSADLPVDVGGYRVLQSGPIDLGTEENEFEVRLLLRGMHSLTIALPATQSRLDVEGTWPHPSFRGKFLPDEHQVNENGFSAHWRGHELSTGIARASWANPLDPSFAEGSVVIELHEPVSIYRSVDRSVKYGLLFIAATFLTLVCFELTTGFRVHILQYATTGATILVFFLTLLALAEHIPFVLAYIISTGLVCGLVGWYVAQVTEKASFGWWFVVMLLAIYGVLFLLLRLEAYALLAGTFVVFVGVLALMWATRSLRDHHGLDNLSPNGGVGNKDHVSPR